MLNEEINKMKYLFGYQKGVVISEQAVPPPPMTGATTEPTTLLTPSDMMGDSVPPPTDAGAIPPPPMDAGAIPPPPMGTGAIPPPPMGDVTTQTTTVPQKVDVDKLRDCAGYKSGGKLTKGEEKDGFTIFNNEKGISVCKKPIE